MRVIAGRFGGRQLRSVRGRLTRPTTNKVKEALFNMIGPYFHGGRFLDLYAGSGGVAIEAVSRGIQHADLVDRQYRAYRTILSNVKLLNAANRFTVLKSSARAALLKFSYEKVRFNYVYLDPPYRYRKMKFDLSKLKSLRLLSPRALVICETDKQVKLVNDVAGYRLLEQRQYGLSVVTIYQFTEL